MSALKKKGLFSLVVLLLAVVMLYAAPTCKTYAACAHDTTNRPWYSGTNPTCTSAGSHWTYCNLCGEKVWETVPATGHDFKNAELIQVHPNCVKDGYRGYKCNNCEYVEKTVWPATGHTWWPSYDTKKEATCTTDGIGVHTCRNGGCGYEEEFTIPATGHNYETMQTGNVSPTCTERGYTKKNAQNAEMLSWSISMHWDMYMTSPDIRFRWRLRQIQTALVYVNVPVAVQPRI